MGQRDIITIEFFCDQCQATEQVTGPRYLNFPKGWGTKTLHGCGLTGYSKTIDLCPACLAKEEKPDAKR